jgi:hypothetical protein
MAGTLFGLGLSQQISAAGAPLSGALLYIYQENSSTPVTTYSDFTLATEQTFPIEADSAGRLPQIWVADGAYRARLTTSAGVEVFDEASVTAIGASSGGGGGGGVDSSSSSGFETGDTMWLPVAGARSGWVRANGRTIGSVASSATERANADTQTLFEYLWSNFSNAVCAVSGGRGATAQADFNANKTIATFDMRGRSPFGLDDMGNSAASRIASGTPTAAATNGGGETATIALANLPSTTLSLASLTGSVGTDIDLNNATGVFRNVNTASNNQTGGGGNIVLSGSTSTITGDLADGTVTFGGSIPLGGSGTALNKMPPYMLGTWHIRL